MRVFIFGLLVVAASASLLESEQFQAFKSDHGKTYKNQVEETKRFNIFNANLLDIEEHNALYEQGLVSYQKGVNQFTDMTQEEFHSYLKTSASKKPSFNTTLFVKTAGEAPKSVDWSKKGQVTGVKNQGKCGACWAFSVTGAAEAAYFRKSKKLVSFSEQQLIDCEPLPDKGCNGGYLAESYPYLQKNGFQDEKSYPYVGKNGKCKYDKTKVVTKVSSYVSIKQEDEKALQEAVGKIGPVSIAMQAEYLSAYKKGIYSDPKCDPAKLDHGVLAVGYGSENGKDYWIMKNSWGKKWGENGYFRIERGVNMCGVAEDMVYPVIK